MRERLFIGQIDLIGWQRPFRWRHGWPAAGLLTRGLLLGLALRKLGLVLSQLPFEALRRAGFDLGARLGAGLVRPGLKGLPGPPPRPWP
jgi:hypothetical protein